MSNLWIFLQASENKIGMQVLYNYVDFLLVHKAQQSLLYQAQQGLLYQPQQSLFTNYEFASRTTRKEQKLHL